MLSNRANPSLNAHAEDRAEEDVDVVYGTYVRSSRIFADVHRPIHCTKLRATMLGALMMAPPLRALHDPRPNSAEFDLQ